MLIVYDSNMKKLAYLENAYDVWYDLKLNELWTCGFTLPKDDKKNQYCEPYNYIELYDGDRRIELFRIMQNNHTKDDKNYIKYECEHVLATLLDDIMFQNPPIGN
ncbi:MAG: phage tail spike protein [Neofamilia sp.]